MRYERNRSSISEKENQLLSEKRVCIVGAGGLGGYVMEMLARIGVGHISIVDGDVFDETNLNRQILSDEKVLGRKKVEVALERMERVNSQIQIIGIGEFLTKENANNLLAGHDVIIDALDDIDTRFIVQDEAEKLAIPMVHGAIAGWYGQVATIMPGDRTLNMIYRHNENKGAETKLGNLSFPPAMVASIEVAEAIKILLDKGEILRHQILFIDLLNQDYHRFELS
ncbi:HesA/MoeB/ThiF family protein [Clostridia bacterium]|nr:HesA/MoeB/ThiF family protein [Clostridia bacterium]